MIPVAAAAAASSATNYVAKHHSAIFSGAASPRSASATLRVHRSLPVSLRLISESKFPNLATLPISSISNGRHQQLPMYSGGHFDCHAKDVESDRSMWKLYERWMAHFHIRRSSRERSKRFPFFKECARYVYSYNNKEHNKKSGNTLGVNMFADQASWELPTGKGNRNRLSLTKRQQGKGRRIAKGKGRRIARRMIPLLTPSQLSYYYIFKIRRIARRIIPLTQLPYYGGTIERKERKEVDFAQERIYRGVKMGRTGWVDPRLDPSGH